jgi:hypothetical protein
MLSRLDHIAYAAVDIREGVDALSAIYGCSLVREVESQVFSLRAAFIANPPVMFEIVEFLDEAIAENRLHGQRLVIDHIAYEVDDLPAVVDHFSSRGVTFCAPDGSPVMEPIESNGRKHLWTSPGTLPGVPLQLIESPVSEG